MADHASAKKRIRRNERRAEINTARRSRLRSFLKKVETEITSGNSADAKEALRLAQKELFKSVSKGILRKETASRKLSRLSARVKAI
ncbi:MAG: 30S ribosomal protein S20 [Alphaproteobacteria bacterium]|nr:MAG: 30S ribosomal protein S20 [Alphaproteobacteria bacterium]